MSTAELTPDSFMAAQNVDLTPDTFMAGGFSGRLVKKMGEFADNPYGIPRPPNPITQEIERRTANPAAGLPGGTTGTPAVSNNAAAGAVLTGLGAAGAAAYGPALLPFVRGAAKATKSMLPYMAASTAIGEARKIPVVGRFIPPYAEMLPWMASGKGESPEVPPEIRNEPFAGEAEPPLTPPERLPPERANPALTSESRTLPGQIGREVIRQAAEPIPPRKGLQLPGTVEQPAPRSSLSEQITGKNKLIQDMGGQPAEAVTPKPSRAVLEKQLGEALGAQPVQPSVPLRDQILPRDFTPVQSSALRGYKYDPATREFEAVTHDGGHYIYGDVSPEGAAAFEAAPSKGKAWPAIKQEGTPVATVVNGKRVPLKPPIALRSASPETNIASAETLRTGDTFVDETGEPRRVTGIEGNKIRTADGTLKTYRGNVTMRGELNSPQAKLAQGGKFNPPGSRPKLKDLVPSAGSSGPPPSGSSLPDTVMEVLNTHPEGRVGNAVSWQKLAEDPRLKDVSPADMQKAMIQLGNQKRVYLHTARAGGEAEESVYGIQRR